MRGISASPKEDAISVIVANGSIRLTSGSMSLYYQSSSSISALLSTVFTKCWRVGTEAPFQASIVPGVAHLDDGTTHRGRGEVHAGWVLDGRAIQDVWILPGLFYGTTLRVYDPGLDAWHILWHDPLTQPRTSSWTSLPICHDADRESAYDPAEQALAEAKERGRMVVDTRIWYTTCAHQRHHAEMG